MTTQCANQTKPCCICGGEGMQGHPEARYDEADAYDVCYHCGGTGTVDSRCCEPPTPEEIIRTKAVESRNFSDSEVTRELADAAKAYLRSYTGVFSFLVEMKASLEQHGGLRTAQVRGVLNCMVSDARRALKTQPVAEAEKVAATNGIFTVVMEDGTHRTIRIRQAQLGYNTENRQFISFLRGSNNLSDYTRCAKLEDGRFSWLFGYGNDGNLRRAVETVLGLNPEQREAAGKLYAMESGNCYKCGAVLTDPISIQTGLGPICGGRE